MYTITALARQFGLSRGTLLYYDRIGLLTPSARSDAGYRLYSPADQARLAAICVYRQAGLAMEDIACILATEGDADADLLQRRLRELGEEIRGLQVKQRVLAGMLKAVSGGNLAGQIDKDAWVAMLRAAGMDDAAMARWHREFETRSPQAHHDFLLSLGITVDEVLQIRRWSAGSEPGS